MLLLLFMLGLEYTGGELVTNLRTGIPAAAVELLLNFTPGLVAGLLLRWTPLSAVLLAGSPLTILASFFRLQLSAARISSA